MLSRGQKRLVHLAKDRLGLNDEEYREILCLYGGARSSNELDPEGFFAVMDHMKELGFLPMRSRSKRRERAGQEQAEVIELATYKQKALISHLEDELGWSSEPERLENFMAKRLNISRVRTKEDAMKVIEALKAMISRKAG